MKKHLFFAFAAAAVLASCSSHDDFDNYSAGTPQAPVDDNSPQEILLGVGAQANVATRGTGTVGGDHNNIDAVSYNKWHNQIINVYMFDKYEVNQVEGVDVSTTPFAIAKDAEDIEIYNNAKFMAPEGETTGAARHIDDQTETEMTTSGSTVTYKRSYYPMNGNFDFWAYRLDDANYKYETTYTYKTFGGAADEGYEEYKVGDQKMFSTAVVDTTEASVDWVKDNEKDSGTVYHQVYVKTTTTKVDNGGPQFTPGNIAEAKITIPLVIDGTQDVMAAQTALTQQDTLTLVDPLPLSDGNSDNFLRKELAENPEAQKRFDGYAQSLYSAKTARKGVQPNLVFSHLLSRFTFDAKAYKKDFAENNADEIRIKKIVVYSKTSGNIVAQYKAVNITDNSVPENYKVSKGQDYAIESKLEVDANEKAKPLSLKARIASEGENSKLVDLTASNAPGKSRDVYYWLKTVDGEGAHKAGDRYNGEGTPTGTEGTDYKKITESGIALPYGEAGDAGKLYTGIGEAMLVMPNEEKYVMDITLEQSVYEREDAAGTGVPSTIKAIESTIKGLEIRAKEVSKGTHIDGDDIPANLEKFAAGNSYNVRVVVYGMSKIEVHTTLEPWVDGGHIDLDPDNQF